MSNPPVDLVATGASAATAIVAATHVTSIEKTSFRMGRAPKGSGLEL